MGDLFQLTFFESCKVIIALSQSLQNLPAHVYRLFSRAELVVCTASIGFETTVSVELHSGFGRVSHLNVVTCPNHRDEVQGLFPNSAVTLLNDGVFTDFLIRSTPASVRVPFT